MIFVLDTHKFIWNIVDSAKLSNVDKSMILDSENLIFVSKISLWEISLKSGIGSLVFNNLKVEELPIYIDECGFEVLDLRIDELVSFHNLPKLANHKDPFDRMLVWQCIKNDYTLISSDKKLEQYKEFGLKIID